MNTCIYQGTRNRHPATWAVHADGPRGYWGATVCQAHLPQGRDDAEKHTGGRAEAWPLKGADSGALFDMPEVQP